MIGKHVPSTRHRAGVGIMVIIVLLLATADHLDKEILAKIEINNLINFYDFVTYLAVSFLFYQLTRLMECLS